MRQPTRKAIVTPSTSQQPIGFSFSWLVGTTPYESTIESRCRLCGVTAIVALPPPLRAQQPDGTTHVCHPTFGGCNHGFEKEPR